MEDFDFNDTAPVPFSEQEFLMENLCIKKGRAAGGYEPPPTRSAARRWKNINEQNMMTRLNEMHIIKKQNAHMSKEAAREIIRKIPVELLAKEWLSKEDASIDMRAYLVDQILPTLILGVERLLREVDEKGLSATNRFEPEFNPINYLAQYLMRNNPRFSNFAEASPYVRGLRQVSEEIKQELFTFEDNRLARIKAETRRKRTDRERYEQQIREGKERRHSQLISQFTEWTNFGERNRVELAVLQNSLSFFLETVELLPPELQEVAKFGHPLEPTDETGKTLNAKEFAQYISLFVEDLPSEIFKLFLVHMSKCAAIQNAAADRENRRIILTNLFLICDYGVLRFMIADRKLGLLDRVRIMILFEKFWDMLMQTREDSMATLRNPRRWPVVEVEEVDDILFDAWQDEPDGGITPMERKTQNSMLEDIRKALLDESEINAAKDEAAKEKWKLEQLEQKSAGYRAKLYKYNVTDFMTLPQYPYLDTMEAFFRNFDNSDGKLTMDHDLYASTITKTARERKKDYRDDLLDLISTDIVSGVSNTDYTTDSEGSTKTDYMSVSIKPEQRMSVKPSDRARKPSRKPKDKNTNSRIQRSSSPEQINKNNNTRENQDTSSEDNQGDKRNSYQTKMQMVLKQRQGANKNVSIGSTSEESSEEAEIRHWPRLNFRFPSSFSSEEELLQQRVGSGPSLISELKPQRTLTCEPQRIHAATSPRMLPPVQMHRYVKVEQHTGDIQKEAEMGGASSDSSLVYYLSVTNNVSDEAEETEEDTLMATEEKEEDTLMATEEKEEDTLMATEEKEEDTLMATEEKGGDTLVASESTSYTDIVNKSETTVIETDAEAIEGKEISLKDQNNIVEAETSEHENTIIDTEKVMDGKMKEGGQANLSAEQDQNNCHIEDKKEVIKDCEGEGKTDNLEIKLFVESRTMGGISGNITAHEVDYDNLKQIRKSLDAEEFEKNINNEFDVERNNKNESTSEGVDQNEHMIEEHSQNRATSDKDNMNISAVEREKDVDIMRELVASQTKMLASKTYTAGRPQENRFTEKAHFPGKCDILDVLQDDNTNRTVEDSNVNSCQRARVINTNSTVKPIPTLSPYSDTFVNLSQFVQMFETFIGPHPEAKIFATLVHYVTDYYQDNESDKTEKLLQAREKANLARKKAQLNTLFEKWDNEASGFLELEDVTEFMCKFKDGQEVEAIRLAQFDLKRQSEYFDGRLSKREFRQFLNMVINELPGRETFDLLVEFLMNSVERSYGERIRGEARKKWLQQINLAALTGGTSMDPVYKAVFQALYKDAETHGGEKRISASIAMLETNKLEPSRGELMLRYAACTPEDCQYMLGKPLYKNMKGVSFQAVESGKPVHVPRVAKHGSIYFWNYDRNPEERSGSFVAVPLKDNKKRVFGTLGVDTMIDPKKEIIFTKHEIQFFQGVAKAFSIAYHYVEKKRKFVHVLESAIPWLHCRCPNIKEITVYFIEPNLRDTNDYVLRKIMVMNNQGKAAHVTELIRLERKDNLFRRYLFDCVESSYTVVAEIHDERHTACPVRDTDGLVVGVVDLNTGHLKNLPKYESREAQRLLRLLQRAFTELSKVSKGEDPQCVLEAEKDHAVGIDIMFERIMLQELRDNISRIDPQSYIEIKGFFEPPRAIAEVLRATVAIFKVDQVGEGEYDEWDDLKNCINYDLISNIKTHDPISSAQLTDADKLQRYLKAVSYGEISEQGSILAQQLYNWVFACLALIDYMLHKMQD